MSDEPRAVSGPPGGAAEAGEPTSPGEGEGEGDGAINVRLTDFEGPLDLLLHLVRKHELDILDIPIAFITDRYLAYLQRMQQLNLDIAGEYMLMAATLAWLKSRELLPPSAEDEAAALAGDDEDPIDPREELIRRLLEYQKYKEAAARLGDRPVVGRNVWLRGAPAGVAAGFEGGDAPPGQLEQVPVFKLIEAFEEVLARSRVKLTHDVVVERLSISDHINRLVDRLEQEPSFTLSSCFDKLEGEGQGLRYQLVVTFLAILEMVRLRIIRVHQPAIEGEIYITRLEADLAAAQQAAARTDEEFSG